MTDPTHRDMLYDSCMVIASSYPKEEAVRLIIEATDKETRFEMALNFVLKEMDSYDEGVMDVVGVMKRYFAECQKTGSPVYPDDLIEMMVATLKERAV
jgi:hypothetical protein